MKFILKDTLLLSSLFLFLSLPFTTQQVDIANNEENNLGNMGAPNLYDEIDVEESSRSKRLSNLGRKLPILEFERDLETKKRTIDDTHSIKAIIEPMGEGLEEKHEFPRASGESSLPSSVFNGDDCDDKRSICITQAVCERGSCRCKNERGKGKYCDIMPSPSSKKKEVLEDITANDDNVPKIKKKVDTHSNLLQFGEECDSSSSERIANFLYGLSQRNVYDEELLLSAVTDIASKQGGNPTVCDYRKFLLCRDRSCQYWAEGVVDKVMMDSKTVYIIKSGHVCGAYPKYFESSVQLRCQGQPYGFCFRYSPPIACYCQNGKIGLQCKKSSPRAAANTEKKQQNFNEQTDMMVGFDHNFIPYGKPCLKTNQCSPDLNMTCVPDHFDLRVKEIQHHHHDHHADYDVNGMINEDEPSRLIQEDEDYDAQIRGFATEIPKKHFRCRCKPGLAPFRKADGDIICKTAAGYQCVQNDECASDQCVKFTCNHQTNFLFFVFINEEHEMAKRVEDFTTTSKSASIGRAESISGCNNQEKPFKLSLLCLTLFNFIWYILKV